MCLTKTAWPNWRTSMASSRRRGSPAAILIIAALMDQSSLLLLSGLGAMTAVLMLVFKDTILSLVASVQIGSNDMMRVGDWIEMSQFSADGDVIDVALHTVKVQNFDKTITTIPTHRFISEGFRNWRGMAEAGGRRIMRSLMIDQGSVRFLNEEDVNNMHRFVLLRPYLQSKHLEIERWNAEQDADGTVNGRRLTNIGTLRAYVLAYLQSRRDIAHDKTLLVRQLAPSENGLPLEIYAFASSTIWAEYEGAQADIFDHLIAIMPEYGLRLFQRPTGADLSGAVECASRAAAATDRRIGPRVFASIDTHPIAQAAHGVSSVRRPMRCIKDGGRSLDAGRQRCSFLRTR